MEKKLYFKFSDGIDEQDIIMQLDGAMEWIKGDVCEYKDGDDPLPEYTLVPIWMTDEEFEKLSESE